MGSRGKPAPNLDIPISDNIVDVSVIDSTTHVRCPLDFFIKEPVLGHDTLDCPSFVFLVEHLSGKKVLFDLGLRKDIECFPPVIQQGMAIAQMRAEKDIAQLLIESATVSPVEIDAIILSHWHADHLGDPSTFPSTTTLVVGPGFKEAFLPGYPADPRGLILETDYSGRQLHEISFNEELQIGGFCAVDYFGDGSFYLLSAPGHAVGHMCALARTTPTTFIFVGGDGCHHCGSLRPNQYAPLPDMLAPSPFSLPPFAQGTVCPGALLKTIHPKRDNIRPFYAELAEAEGRNVAEAEKTIQKMIGFDANENIMIMTAHDKSLLGTIDFFPKTANQWKQKGWKEASRWKFLEDFHVAMDKNKTM